MNNQLTNRVSQIIGLYWIIKIAFTTLGEVNAVLAFKNYLKAKTTFIISLRQFFILNPMWIIRICP